MPNNFFITGEPKSGKTTLLKEIVKELKKKGLKVGGFISPEERHHGTRNAFHVMSVETGREEVLASVLGDGPKVSKYHVDIQSFESIAIPAMERHYTYDVFIIDEIGRMEMKSSEFGRLLDNILESHTPLIATLHQDYVSEFGQYGQVFELSEANRQAVFTRVIRNATETFGKKSAKEKKEKPASKKKAKAPAGTKVRPAKGKPKAEKRVPAKSAREKAAGELREAGREEKREKAHEEKTEKAHEENKKGFFDHLKELIHS